jgi:hypothetical protein
MGFSVSRVIGGGGRLVVLVLVLVLVAGAKCTWGS